MNTDEYAWERGDWADTLVIALPVIQPPVVRPGSLWAAKHSGRRALCAWTSQGSVKLQFSDNPEASVILAEKDVTRLYHEVI